ncbi:MAG: SPASM domain-containing protein [bacterium]|nr:SPASM domain-containing protein [bacterium]
MTTVILVTNGIKLADEEYCKRIALPGLGISMHRQAVSSVAEKIVDCLAQKKRTFQLTEKAWDNISKYWQGNVCVQLNILKPLFECGAIMDVFQWVRKMNYEPVMELTKPGPIFERGNSLDVSVDEVKELYEKMQEFDLKHYPQCYAEIIVPPSYGHNCTLVETGVHININGNVIPCVAHDSLPLGNIFDTTLDNILEKSELRLAIQDYRNWIVGPCKDCQYFEYCHGGCRGEAFWDTGCPRASDPYCWYIPKGMTLKDMVPRSCAGCLLENHPGCNKKI